MATAMQTRLILQKLKKSITKPNHIVSPYHEEIQNLVIQDLISTGTGPVIHYAIYDIRDVTYSLFNLLDRQGKHWLPTPIDFGKL